MTDNADNADRLVPIASLARTIRSKNAKTHFVTLEIIFDRRVNYERVKDSRVVTEELIARLYRIPREDIVFFCFYDPGRGIKMSIKRPTVSGSPGDADIFGCQQYAPLFNIMIPWPWADGILE